MRQSIILFSAFALLSFGATNVSAGRSGKRMGPVKKAKVIGRAVRLLGTHYATPRPGRQFFRAKRVKTVDVQGYSAGLRIGKGRNGRTHLLYRNQATLKEAKKDLHFAQLQAWYGGLKPLGITKIVKKRAFRQDSVDWSLALEDVNFVDSWESSPISERNLRQLVDQAAIAMRRGVDFHELRLQRLPNSSRYRLRFVMSDNINILTTDEPVDRVEIEKRLRLTFSGEK